MSLSSTLFRWRQLAESLTKQALDNSLSETGIAIRFSESVYLFRSPGTCYSGPSESVKQSVHRFRRKRSTVAEPGVEKTNERSGERMRDEI